MKILTNLYKVLIIIILLIIFTDVTKSQTTITTFPYLENFESTVNGGFGDWVQIPYPPEPDPPEPDPPEPDPIDNFDWSIGTSTPTENTGPQENNGNTFIYIEADGRTNLDYAAIEASFNFENLSVPILSFDYHRYGDSEVGFLVIDLFDGVSWTNNIWNSVEDNINADQWNNVKICLSSYNLQNKNNVKIRFKANVLNSIYSDIALDNIEVRNLEIESVSSVNPTCNGYSDGTLEVVLKTNNIGFGPTYSYTIDEIDYGWVDDEYPFHLFEDVPARQYIVQVKDVSGCIASWSANVYVEDPPDNTEILYDANDVTGCFNYTNGDITIDAGPDALTDYTYSIDGGETFSTSNYFGSLSKNDILNIVVHKLSDGCNVTGPQVIIGGPEDITIAEMEVNNVTGCNGNNNGSIIVTADAGVETSELVYSLNGEEYSDVYEFYGLSGDEDYYVSIQNPTGCTLVSETYTITQPSLVEITSFDYNDVTGCYGDANASFYITATGGTGTLLYTINDMTPYQTSGTFEGFSIGDYHIRVKDANGCIVYGEEVTIEQPDKLEITSISPENISGCTGNANGEIVINATGGTGVLQYSIYYDAENSQYINLQTGNTFQNLDIGTYFPYVVDENGCNVEGDPITLSQPSELVINEVITSDVNTCYDAADGTISIYVDEGTYPYEYSIDGGVTFSDENVFFNLQAGEYSIFVRDANECTIQGETYTLTQPTQIVITEEFSTNVSCNGGNDAMIIVEAEGGTGQLSFSVNNGADFPYSAGDISYHSAGTYQIKVKDINNCVIIGSTIVITEPEELIIQSYDVTNVQGCYGDTNGSIILNVTGGTEPLSFSVDGGSTFQDSAQFYNLGAALDYIPFVIDANGCLTYTDPFLISEPDNLYVVNDTHTDIQDCHGSAAGTITVIANGGTEPLFFSIDDGETYFENEGYFTGLTAGTYKIRVKDFYNCEAEGFIETIVEPSQMYLDSVIVEDIICHGQSNGQLFIYAHGGQYPLKYSINGGIDTLYASQFLGLWPGDYDIEVYDYYGCTLDTTVNIFEPDTLMLTGFEYTNIESCYGNTEGTITVYGEGGMPEVLFSYCQLPYLPAEFTSNNHFTNLPAGTYYVAVKDQNECVQTSELFNITQPDPIFLSAWSKEDITCFGENDGEIHLTAQGGGGMYFYTINGGDTWEENGGDFYNLPPSDEYICGAKDRNGCFSETNFRYLTIFEPSLLEISNVQVFDISCFNANDGGIKIQATGGTNPYLYTLNEGIFQNDNTIDNLSPGVYIPYIQDDNGCIAEGEPVELTNPERISNFVVNQTVGCSPLSVNFVPDNPQYYFTWDFDDGETTNSVSPTHVFYNEGSLSHDFNVLGIASYLNCSDTTEIVITVRPLPDISFEVDEEVKFYPDTIFYLTNTSQSGFTNYFWDFGDGQTFDSPSPDFHSYPECGDYEIKMSATNEFCSDTVKKIITLTAFAPGANFTISENSGCAPIEITFENQTDEAVSYLWEMGDGASFEAVDTTYVYETSGEFQAKLTAFGYCNTSSTFSKKITIFDNPIADFSVEPDTVVINQRVRFFDNSVDASFYFWMFGDGDVSVESTPIHLYDEPGVFDVTLITSSESGCNDTLVIKNAVTVADKPYVLYPTAFTPNGDNHNDYFIPIYGQIIEAELMIFDKRGKIVFKTDDLSNYWDGKSLNGEYCEQGVYVWKIKGIYLGGQLFTEVGSVTLLR